jgi:adenylate kinase family enzyme
MECDTTAGATRFNNYMNMPDKNYEQFWGKLDESFTGSSPIFLKYPESMEQLKELKRRLIRELKKTPKYRYGGF